MKSVSFFQESLVKTLVNKLVNKLLHHPKEKNSKKFKNLTAKGFSQ